MYISYMKMRRCEKMYSILYIYIYMYGGVTSYYTLVQIFRETSLTKSILKNLKNRVLYQVEDTRWRIKGVLEIFENLILTDKCFVFCH